MVSDNSKWPIDLYVKNCYFRSRHERHVRYSFRLFVFFFLWAFQGTKGKAWIITKQMHKCVISFFRTCLLHWWNVQRQRKRKKSTPSLDLRSVPESTVLTKVHSPICMFCISGVRNVTIEMHSSVSFKKVSTWRGKSTISCGIDMENTP